jgi:hypothetical protein
MPRQIFILTARQFFRNLVYVKKYKSSFAQFNNTDDNPLIDAELNPMIVALPMQEAETAGE